jgi:hypothetical protein
MERVVLTSCCRRMKYGQVQDAGPSEFIREIPAEHLREERVKRIRRPPEHAASAEHIREVLRPLAEAPIHAEDRDLKPLRPPSPGSVKAGDRVRHKMFGKGKVKSVIRSSQTLLRIEFNNGVKKTIAEKFVEKI